MIRNCILPERIGTYYLFAKRVIGFDINRMHVTATKVLLKGANVVIEQIIEEKLEVGVVEHEERVVHAIKSIINQMPKYNEIRTAVSSSVVVFKELHMPFSSHEQIKMAVEFEVDPLLPFSANDAVIDFIITKVHPEDNSADILVAAVQNHHIAEHLQPFEVAGVNASVITVDLFALYGLYKRIPAYQSEIDNVALIDLGSQATGIGYIKDHQLSYIRSLPKGVNAIAKTVAKELKMQPGQAIGEVVRFGIKKEDDSKHTQAVANAIRQFWKEVQFTLSSFMGSERGHDQKESMQEEGSQRDDHQKELIKKEDAPKEDEVKNKEHENAEKIDPKNSDFKKDDVKENDKKESSQQEVDIKKDDHADSIVTEQSSVRQKVILLGMATDIEGLPAFLQTELGVECELFDIASLAHDSSVTIKTSHPIKSTHIMSVSIAMPSYETEYFNLRQKEFAPSTATLLLKQLLVSATFLILLFGSLITFMFFQIHNLKKESQVLEADTVAEIKERFKGIDEDEDTLEDVIDAAKREVEGQEKLLSAFLQSSRSSALNYLLELTKRLNAKALGLQVEQIAIKEDRILFKARVRDYEALKILEYDLAQSPLFKHIPPQEDPEFSMDIVLTKRKSNGTY